MTCRVQVIFYSLYGHVWKMAEAVAEGARRVPGGEVQLLQIAETLPPAVLEKMHAAAAKQAFAHIPLADPKNLAEADAIILGVPTRFGSACAQVQTFLDATGQLWATGALVGKVASAFTSTGTQHGGQETTIMSVATFFFHQGMVIVGCPYTAKGLTNMSEITGGSPYGAGTLSGGDGSRQPSANELEIARFQGEHVARIAAKLAAK